jgi:hypothetical protein
VGTNFAFARRHVQFGMHQYGQTKLLAKHNQKQYCYYAHFALTHISGKGIYFATLVQKLNS